MYRWLCPFMFTTLFLAIMFQIADLILRTKHLLFISLTAIFQVLCVLGNLILLTRQSKVKNILRKLESLDPAKIATSPPRAAKFMLLLVPKRHREHLIGDLEEEYITILLPEYGARKAQCWYWWQVAISVGPLLRAQIKRGVAIAWLWKRVR
jgi:hypothetical protein